MGALSLDSASLQYVQETSEWDKTRHACISTCTCAASLPHKVMIGMHDCSQEPSGQNYVQHARLPVPDIMQDLLRHAFVLYQHGSHPQKQKHKACWEIADALLH